MSPMPTYAQGGSGSPGVAEWRPCLEAYSSGNASRGQRPAPLVVTCPGAARRRRGRARGIRVPDRYHNRRRVVRHERVGAVAAQPGRPARHHVDRPAVHRAAVHRAADRHAVGRGGDAGGPAHRRRPRRGTRTPGPPPVPPCSSRTSSAGNAAPDRPGAVRRPVRGPPDRLPRGVRAARSLRLRRGRGLPRGAPSCWRSSAPAGPTTGPTMPAPSRRRSTPSTHPACSTVHCTSRSAEPHPRSTTSTCGIGTTWGWWRTACRTSH